MTECTRSRVDRLTVPVSFSTALTVALETSASRATSLMVGFFIRAETRQGGGLWRLGPRREPAANRG